MPIMDFTRRCEFQTSYLVAPTPPGERSRDTRQSVLRDTDYFTSAEPALGDARAGHDRLAGSAEVTLGLAHDVEGHCANSTAADSSTAGIQATEAITSSSPPRNSN